MNKMPKIIPISEMKLNQAQVIGMLEGGPVVLAQRSKPAAVLVSMEEWDRIADEIQRYRVIAEAKQIAARNDAAGSWVSGEEMQRIMAERGVHVAN